MTKQAAKDIPGEGTRTPEATRPTEMPDDGHRCETESDDPAPEEEDPAGYGYGV